MSGIYILGMVMPTDENERIDIRLFSDGNVAVWNKQKGWIPYSAIPVPDHGRLIDADNLDYVSVSIDKRGCISKIDAPIILPADKERDV